MQFQLIQGFLQKKITARHAKHRELERINKQQIHTWQAKKKTWGGQEWNGIIE